MMSDYALAAALIVFYLICLWSQKKKKKEDHKSYGSAADYAIDTENVDSKNVFTWTLFSQF